MLNELHPGAWAARLSQHRKRAPTAVEAKNADRSQTHVLRHGDTSCGVVVAEHQNANSCQKLCAGTLAAVPQPLLAAAPKATGLVLAAQARQSPPRPIVRLASPRRRAVLLSCTPCLHPPRVPQDSSLRCLPPARRPPCGARTAESSRVPACSDRHGATHHRLTDRFGLYRRRA
jgi:hypothetical protein